MKTNALRAIVAGSAFLPAVAFSAPPVGFGTTWTDDGAGNITYTCDAGFTCDANPISDTGFMQVQITNNGTGESYFQTIISNQPAGGENFSTESFVVAGSTNGGISTNQTLSSPDVANSGTLDTTSLIETGSFGGGTDTIRLEQRVIDSSTEFTTGFIYNASTDQGTGVRTANMSLGQTNTPAAGDYSDNFRYDLATTTSGAGVVTVDSLAIDIASNVQLTDNGGAVIGNQSFDYTLRQSGAVPDAGATATLTSGTITGPGSITWAASDSVERVLVGQSMTGIGSFGYERLADTDETTSTFDLTSVGPFDDIGAGNDPFSPALGALSYTTF